MGVAMRRRRHEWAPKGVATRRGLVNRLGCLRRASQRLSGYRASERLSGYRASAWWEYEDRGAWRSLPPDHAKRVEANYVAGCRDCCAHDPKDPDVEWEYDFEYMDLTCREGAERKGGWYWIRRVMILDSGPCR